MSGSYVVCYDDSEGAKRAVDYAVDRAKTSGSKVEVVHVLEWSPYSFLTPEELEERHRRRQEELERAAKSVVEPVVAQIRGAGVNAEGIVRYGHVARVICEIASEHDATQIVVGRTGESGLASRLFGSLPAALVQTASVPVTVVP